MQQQTEPRDHQSESALVAAAARGDTESFSRLVRPYQPKLYAFLRLRRRHDSDIEDLLQDVLLKAWRGLLSGHAPRRFGSWLFSIARRRLIDRSRHERARVRLVTVNEIPTPVEIETPENRMQALETQDHIVSAIGELPEKQREVFLLRLTGELTFREIADMRDEPLSTVLGHMSYAVANLKRRLDS